MFSSKALWPYVKAVAITGYVYCLYYTVSEHVISFILLQGNSMRPTINSGGGCEIVIVEAISVKRQSLERNDVVIAKQPDNPNTLICKRISALEGERVKSAVISQSNRVPQGHVWLLGDDSGSSYDSRHFGPLPQALLVGRVCFRVWPLSKFGRVTD